jgi:exosortase A-associated hydrolase 2
LPRPPSAAHKAMAMNASRVVYNTRMEPLYFGKRGRTLFGIYHAPHRDSDRRVGVVLGYPMGQEYIRSHRAFFRLAVLLSSAGFHVLRFDFYGCGDSEGDFEEARLSHWIEDMGMAIEELRGGSDADRMFVVGLRLGATLALMAGMERDDIGGIALWEPIVNGKAYIDELVGEHNAWLQGSFAKPKRPAPSEQAQEILGFPLSSSLASDLEQVDLLRIRGRPAREILMIESKEVQSKEMLVEALRGIGVSVRCERFPGSDVWIKKQDELHKSIVPVDVLQCIVSWLSDASR